MTRFIQLALSSVSVFGFGCHANDFAWPKIQAMVCSMPVTSWRGPGFDERATSNDEFRKLSRVVACVTHEIYGPDFFDGPLPFQTWLSTQQLHSCAVESGMSIASADGDATFIVAAAMSYMPHHVTSRFCADQF